MSTNSLSVATARPLYTHKPVLGVPSLCRPTFTKQDGFITMPRANVVVRRKTALQAVTVVEIAQIAEADAAYIWSTAAISFACVLVGIAIGFVLLRAESLVEDGTIKL